MSQGDWPGRAQNQGGYQIAQGQATNMGDIAQMKAVSNAQAEANGRAQGAEPFFGVDRSVAPFRFSKEYIPVSDQPFPASVADLTDLVRCMRDLGVVSAFGVVLGPPPPRAQEIAVALRDAPPEKAAELTQELAAELRTQRISDALDEVREKLAATGREYTDEELWRFVSDARKAQIEAMNA
jgi:hypothetical protein